MTAPGCQNDSTARENRGCPSYETLEQFSQLALPESTSQWLGQHVQECLSCQKLLDELTDSHLKARALGSTVGNRDDETIQRLLHKLCSGLGIADVPGSVAVNIHFDKATDRDALGRLQHYIIRRELGSGATATVFEAIDTRDDQSVAIKFIRAKDENTLGRVRREVNAIAQIQHPGIVSIQSIEVTSDGRLYLVMPLVLGTTLAEQISDGLPLPFERTCEIIIDVADALAAVHDQGLLHRDIKPSNILLDQAGNPKLTDFGLVTFLDGGSSLTDTGATVGTPCYMSPEQASGQRQLDARSDVYSLGATLYECLTRTKPFRGPTAEVIRQVVRVDPVAPRRIDPSVPVELEVICLKAMAKRNRTGTAVPKSSARIYRAGWLAAQFPPNRSRVGNALNLDAPQPDRHRAVPCAARLDRSWHYRYCSELALGGRSERLCTPEFARCDAGHRSVLPEDQPSIIYLRPARPTTTASRTDARGGTVLQRIPEQVAR